MRSSLNDSKSERRSQFVFFAAVVFLGLWFVSISQSSTESQLEGLWKQSLPLMIAEHQEITERVQLLETKTRLTKREKKMLILFKLMEVEAKEHIGRSKEALHL